ncbi:hypothetical protein F4780DRAFT_130192 [Xylariomycetidae sp. FL0641]|nr:hypothetical protein F4780DRAFT_130192 [Xylariomycetidae sp. FL0641]
MPRSRHRHEYRPGPQPPIFLGSGPHTSPYPKHISSDPTTRYAYRYTPAPAPASSSLSSPSSSWLYTSYNTPPPASAYLCPNPQPTTQAPSPVRSLLRCARPSILLPSTPPPRCPHPRASPAQLARAPSPHAPPRSSSNFTCPITLPFPSFPFPSLPPGPRKRAHRQAGRRTASSPPQDTLPPPRTPRAVTPPHPPARGWHPPRTGRAGGWMRARRYVARRRRRRTPGLSEEEEVVVVVVVMGEATPAPRGCVEVWEAGGGDGSGTPGFAGRRSRKMLGR